LARRYDRDLEPIGAEFRVNTDTAGIQRRPAVAASPSGDFLVVWQGQTGGIKDARIFGQFVGTAGNLVGPQFRVSQGHSLSQAHISPALTALPAGRFLVAWMDWKEIYPLGLFGVEIDGLGNEVADEIQINNRRLTAHFRTYLSAGPNGEVFMPYESYRTNNGAGITARRVVSE
ncbi:MAG TPA: hypothetical protein VHN15_13655, partial [Thermoanaerobaculia bacterium]|nr:hypothetical protein [Thermoanaerobaculia bacterium]